MLALVIVAALMGAACWAVALFARDDRPYDSDLLEASRRWLAPRRLGIMLIGVALFVPLLLFVARWQLGS